MTRRGVTCEHETTWGASGSPLVFLRVKWDTRKGWGQGAEAGEMRVQGWAGMGDPGCRVNSLGFLLEVKGYFWKKGLLANVSSRRRQWSVIDSFGIIRSVNGYLVNM